MTAPIIVNDPQVPPQVLQLLFPGLPDHPLGLLPGFGKAVVLPPGLLTVCPWFLSIAQSLFMQDVDDLFRLLPRFVQKTCVGRKADVLRHAGRVQNQCALVGRFFLRLFEHTLNRQLLLHRRPAVTAVRRRLIIRMTSLNMPVSFMICE